MRHVFADTFYWIALAHPKDDWHERSKRISASLGNVRILTTDSVLTEFLNAFSERGDYWRKQVTDRVRSILGDPNIQAIPQTRNYFLAGLKLYEERLDKGYSLTDCISMVTMRDHGVTEVLTHDHHFEQEGFTILLKD